MDEGSLVKKARILHTIKRDRKILYQKGKVVNVIGNGTKPNFVIVEYRKTKVVEVPSKSLEFLYE